jgi:transposase-like protein
MFAAEIRKNRSAALRALPQWRWHLDEVFVKINGETHCLWGRWIAKARCWESLRRSAEIVRLHRRI